MRNIANLNTLLAHQINTYDVLNAETVVLTRTRARADEGGLRQVKDARSIIRKVLITEKGTELREVRNQYVFEVARDANKIEIKQAVETVFWVKVAGVRTLQQRGKVRRQGRWVGKRNDWKKAIVTLQPDQKIELFEQI